MGSGPELGEALGRSPQIATLIDSGLEPRHHFDLLRNAGFRAIAQFGRRGARFNAVDSERRLI